MCWAKRNQRSVTFAITALIACWTAFACDDGSRAKREAEISRRASEQRQRWRDEARARLESAPANLSQSEVIALCSASGAEGTVLAVARDRCAKAFAGRAGEAIDARSLASARADIADANRWSPSQMNVRKVSVRLERIDEAERISKAAAAAAQKRRAKAAVARMRKKIDEVEGTTWYYDPSTPRYTNYDSFHIYIGSEQDSAPWLRLRIQYVADDWLFVNSFIVVADGQRFDKPLAKFERDNGGGEIWEWYDESTSPDDLKMIETVANSKKATLRLVGDKYRHDRTISATEKAALKSVLAAFHALRGGTSA
jgi:hypothetical protein